MAAGMINRIALLIRERFTEDNHYEIVKMVISEMREPTEEMIKVVDGDILTKLMWRAMIDKALQE